MKDRKKPEKFLLPHGMPSDGCEFAFSSRVPSKALTIKIPYTSRNYQFSSFYNTRSLHLPASTARLALPYAVPAVGIVPLRRPCHRESKSYAMCNGTVPGRWSCLGPIRLRLSQPCVAGIYFAPSWLVTLQGIARNSAPRCVRSCRVHTSSCASRAARINRHPVRANLRATASTPVGHNAWVRLSHSYIERGPD
jgi:hypothetical protein